MKLADLITSLLVATTLGACSASDSAPRPETPANAAPKPEATAPTAASPERVGPFDLSRTTFDLATLVPDGQLAMHLGTGAHAPDKDTDRASDSITIEVGGKTVAEVELHDEQPTIERIHVFLQDDKDAFASAHPGLVCDAPGDPLPLECQRDRDPDRVFYLDPEGTHVVEIDWTAPATPAYAITTPRPRWAESEMPEVELACQQLVRFTSACGLAYDRGRGWYDLGYEGELSEFELAERCMSSGADEWPVYPQNVLDELETVRCTKLPAELAKHPVLMTTRR